MFSTPSANSTMNNTSPKAGGREDAIVASLHSSGWLSVYFSSWGPAGAGPYLLHPISGACYHVESGRAFPSDDDTGAGTPLQFLQQLPYRLRLFILGSTVGCLIVLVTIFQRLNEAFEQWLLEIIPTALGTFLTIFIISLFTLFQD